MKVQVIVLMLLAALGTGPAVAKDRFEEAPARGDRLDAARPGISADEAARRAQDQYGGRVLAVRPEGPGFRVKLLKDGEVRTVYMGP